MPLLLLLLLTSLLLLFIAFAFAAAVAVAVATASAVVAAATLAWLLLRFYIPSDVVSLMFLLALLLVRFSLITVSAAAVVVA